MVFVCAHIVLLCRASPRSLRSFEHLVSSGKHLSGMCSLICWLNLNNQFSNLIIKCTENFRNVARYLEVIEFRLHFHCMFGFAFFPLFLRRESVHATAKQKVMEKKYTPFFASCIEEIWRNFHFITGSYTFDFSVPIKANQNENKRMLCLLIIFRMFVIAWYLALDWTEAIMAYYLPIRAVIFRSSFRILWWLIRPIEFHLWLGWIVFGSF